MEQKRLLLVDDNSQSLKLIKAIFDSEDFDTITATDGKEAFDILMNQKIDLVVTDVLMPNIDGYYLCYKIRTSDSLKHTPVIIYTATYTSNSEEKIALELGADRFIRKPAAKEVLITAVKEILTSPQNRSFNILRDSESFEHMHQYSSELVTKLETRNIELEENSIELKIAQENYKQLVEQLESKVKSRTIELEENVQQLRESEEKFFKAFQSSAAGITFTRTSDMTIVDVNDAYTQMTGYTRDELLNHSSAEHDLIVDSAQKEALNHLERKGSAREIELSIRHKTNDKMNTTVNITLLVPVGATLHFCGKCGSI